MEIELGSGISAIVDAEDYTWLSAFNWKIQSGGYAVALMEIEGEKRLELMHRAIMRHAGFDISKKWIDHKNRIRLDNRRANLRLADRTQNTRNQKVHSNSLSGLKGVTFKDHLWYARIVVDRHEIRLGYYDTSDDAAIAYNHAALQHFGEFAVFNDISGWREKYPVRRQKTVKSVASHRDEKSE